MNISLATPDDIPELCRLLGYLFAQEAEFKPDIQLQQQGLKAIIQSPESGTIMVSREGRSAGGYGESVIQHLHCAGRPGLCIGRYGG